MNILYNSLSLLFFGIYWLIILLITLRIVLKRNVVSVSLSWLLIIYTLPIIGIICYFLFGELHLGRTRALRAQNMFAPYKQWFYALHDLQMYNHDRDHNNYLYRIDTLCGYRLGLPALNDNQLELKSSAKDIFNSLITDINNAKTDICMVFYIWHIGGMANLVVEALINAANRNVRIKILLDAAGSHKFFKSSYYTQMKDANIAIISALDVKLWRIFLRRLDLRQHRKIIVIDNTIAYTGSMNLVDPTHFRADDNVGQWIDIMVRITGPTVNILSAIHSWDWEVETGERNLPSKPLDTFINSQIHCPIQVVPSGPAMPEHLISQTLILALFQANYSICITSPYFVPSQEILEALKMTSQRGVKIEIIIPHKNNSIMVQWAARSLYSELLTAGILIYEFNGGLLHTKSVVIDDKLCLIGTVNMDTRSLRLNFELTLVIASEDFTQQILKLQQKYIVSSILIDEQQWMQRSLKLRLLERFFYLFNPLL